MADNTTLNSGTGGDTVAADDIGGVKYPRSKIVLGADGTNDGDVCSANPLPISAASLPTHAVTQSGTWTMQPGNTANVTAWLVTGTGGVFPVTGTFWQATQPVSIATAPVLVAGAAIIGKVGIDQTTPGTTNLVAAGQNGTWTVGLSAAQTLATVTTVGTVTTITNVVHVDDNSGSLTVDYATTGSGNATGALRVELANNGTGTLSTLTTCSTVTTLTGSGIAHDGVDSGNPHKIGAKATTSLSAKTLVASDDRTDLFAGLDGVQITRPHTNLEDICTGVAAITDGSSTSVIAAAGANIKIYITEVIIANSSATNVTVDLRDGTAGSVKATFMAPATGGAHKTLSTPIPFTANTAVAADPSAAASTVTVTLLGFKSKV